MNESRTSRKSGTDVAVGMHVAGTIGRGGAEPGQGAGPRDVLTDLLRREAVNLLAAAIQHEVGRGSTTTRAYATSTGIDRSSATASCPSERSSPGSGP